MTDAQIKQAVRERDGMACIKCGLSNDEHKRLTGRQLHVHRVVQGSEYCVVPGVCVTLCRRCHDAEPRVIRTRAEIAREYVRPEPPQRPTSIAEVVAANLRVERARRRLSMKEVGQIVGESAVTISRYESGQKVPTLETLLKLADAYGVAASALLATAESTAVARVKKK